MNKRRNHILVEQLQAAHDNLTPKTWVKNTYFGAANNQICNCAHGAVQVCANPKIYSILNNDSESLVCRSSLATRLIMNSNDSIYMAQSEGVRTAHYSLAAQKQILSQHDPKFQPHVVLGMVGLSFDFNDRPNTTFDMVKQKFQQAIKLAKQLTKGTSK